MQDARGNTGNRQGSGKQEEGRRDLLAYGTQVVLDGRAADLARLGSLETVERYVMAAMERLEPGEQPLVRTVVVTEGQGAGVSAVARLKETGVMAHTFTALGRLTVRLRALLTSRTAAASAAARSGAGLLEQTRRG